MIVKCECDCKYCEKGYCTKEEIEISDTGEGMYCGGYEQSEESFLNQFVFEYKEDDYGVRYCHIVFTSVFASFSSIAYYMIEEYPLVNIDCKYYIFDMSLVGGYGCTNRFVVSEGKDFDDMSYSKKSAYVKNSCEIIRDYKLYDCGTLTSVQQKMIANGMNI